MQCARRDGFCAPSHPCTAVPASLQGRQTAPLSGMDQKNRCDMTLAGGDQASLCLKPCLVCTTSQKTHSFELDTVLLLILRYFAHAHTRHSSAFLPGVSLEDKITSAFCMPSREHHHSPLPTVPKQWPSGLDCRDPMVLKRREGAGDVGSLLRQRGSSFRSRRPTCLLIQQGA